MQFIRGFHRYSAPPSLQLNFKASFHGHKGLFASDRRKLSLDDLPGPHSNLNGFSLAKKFILDGLKLLTFQQKETDLDLGKILLKAQLRNVENFGPIFRTKYTGLRTVVNVKISNPSDAAAVFRAEGRSPIRPESPAMNYYRKKTKKLPGLLFGNGTNWYKYRRWVNDRMLKPQCVEEYIPSFNEIVTDFMARIEKLKGIHGLDNEVPQLEEELFKWSFESVSLVLFDERFGALEDEIDHEVQEFIQSSSDFLNASAAINVRPAWMMNIFQTKMYKQFTQSCDKLYEFTGKCIKRKLTKYEEQNTSTGEQNQSQNREFLEVLSSKSDMTYKDMVATYVDIFFAGVDTTSNAVLWSLYELAKNQDKQFKLHQEISTVLKPGEILSADSLSKMSYLKSCIKEVLRLYPIYFVHRETEQDLVLSGYKIPAGTQVMILSYAMGISDKYFEEPLSFIPERWLRTQRRPSKSSSSVEAFASLPFGYGTRMCVGRRLSELEQYLLLTRIIQKYQIFHIGEEPEPKVHGLPIIPDRPLRIQFVQRE